VASDALPAIAAEAGLRVRTSTVTPSSRRVAELVRGRPTA